MFFGSRLNRLATSIRRGISKYSVGSDNPGLVFDFIDNFYQKDKNQTVNFDGAITHARSSNATMTDGYGPELVVNGGFDSDLSGWETSGSATQSNQKAVIADVGGTDGYISQEISTVSGTTYVVEYNFSAVTNRLFLKIGTSKNGNNILQEPDTATGHYSYTFTATGSSTWITFLAYDANHSGAVDNVSVREMPVLKWAPHNELTYSAFDSATPTNWSVGFGTGTYNHTLGSEISNLPTITQEQTASGRSYLTQNVTLKANTIYTLKMLVDENLSSITDGNNKILSANISGASGTLSASIDDVSDGKVEITFTTGSTTSGTVRTGIGVLNDAVGTVVFAAPHLYRSDLGGMVDNPDRGDSYVPTTSSAKQLPRVGHHVYNGSAWVNEGLLAESESRTNKEKYSDFASSIIANNLTVSTDQAVSPDGTENATELTETGANDYHRVYQGANKTGTANSDHTFSAYVKRGSGTRDIQLRGFYLGTGAPYVNFDLGDGTVGSSSGASGTSVSGHTWTLSNTNIQDVGNGWYRVSATVNASSDFTVGFVLIDDASTAIELEVYQGDNTSSVLIYGAQFEAASTPSSLVPTSGSTVTRAAETFTIPSANLPWPTPQYIGSELVTNGDFSTDSDWTKNAGWSIASGVATYTNTGSNSEIVQTISGLTVGNVYQISVNIISNGSSIRLRAASPSAVISPSNITGTGEATLVFTAAGTNESIRVRANAGGDVTIDNVSVREINPLSVSIGMEGRITYADEDAGSNAGFFNWQFNSVNYLRFYLSTSGNRLGEPRFEQRESDDGKTTASGASSIFKPDVLTPFDISGRYGSTFVNGAVDGVALTAITTPTALPDLSSTDLNLAYDYMGTISEFRVWDKDIGDAGIVEATNPSLEPSLSLTFEGTGTNSFVVNNWSE